MGSCVKSFSGNILWNLPFGGRQQGLRWPSPFFGRTVNGNCGDGVGAPFTELSLNTTAIAKIDHASKFIVGYLKCFRRDKYLKWKENKSLQMFLYTFA